MTRRIRTALFLLCFLTTAHSAFALEVNRTELPSGLLVLHSERHNLPLVMVTLLMKAGMYDEQKEGVSNLTASLLTEGTKRRTAAQISDEIEFIGAALDASSGADYSTVTLSVLKKDIETGFDLFSDILLNPAFSEDEIKRQKDLIKGSLRRSEEDPSFLASREFAKSVYGGHPYGRLLSGSAEAVDKIDRSDIAGFYKDYYLPGNSVLCVVGDLTPDELKKLIDKYLGGWSGKTVNKRKGAAIPKPSAKLYKIEKDLTQANILMGHIGIRRDDPDYYALSLMNYILGGGGFSSRLMASIRDEKGLAYSVYSTLMPSKEPGLFRIGVETKNASANAVIEEILNQIKRLREEGGTEAELRDAKSFMVGSFPRRLDTLRKVADFLAQVEFFGLGDDYIERYPKLINSVTTEDILRVSRKYLQPENLILIVVAKQKEADIKDPFKR